MMQYSNDSLSDSARVAIDSLYDMSTCRDHVLFLDVLDAIKNANDSQIANEILTFRFDDAMLDSDYFCMFDYLIIDQNETLESYILNISRYIEDMFYFECTETIHYDDIDIFNSVTFSRMFSERVA
jgi:hypothetical protein